MIKIRPDKERGRGQHGWLDAKHSFSFAHYWDPQHVGFHTLRVLNEDVVQPQTGFTEHGHDNMEIITFIIDGSLTHRDSTGSTAELSYGDVQVMSAGSGIRHSETNESSDQKLHLLQIWLTPGEQDIAPRHAEAHFDVEQKFGRLQALASKDGRDGSLKICQDATVYASILEKDATLSHSVKTDNKVWLQIVTGEVAVNNHILQAGDGAGITDESALNFVATQRSEFLLFDLE